MTNQKSSNENQVEQKEKEQSNAIINRAIVRSVFAEYVSDFDETNGKVKLKIDHTYRVAAICDRIANSLTLSGEEKETAWLLGMLHDIGRFKQIRKYDTFTDAISEDHALLSTQVLFEEGYIRKFIESDKYDDIIYKSIRYHNAYRLPEGLNEKEILFCNLIRDADKIDILKVNAEIPLTVVWGKDSEHAVEEEITKEVMQDYMEEHAVLRAHQKAHIDHVVSDAALVFELVYPISFIITKEQGYLDQLLDFKSKNKKTQEQFVLLRQKMSEFLQRRM